MKINILAPDVFEIEEFVSVEEQNIILNFFKNTKESDWFPKKSDEFVEEKGLINHGVNGNGEPVSELGFFYGKTYQNKLPEFFENIELRIKNLFYSYYLIDPISLHRHLKGDKHKPHKDYDPINQKRDYHIRYGIVIYFNDDYAGGALDYPELGIIHKPKARSLMMHAGNILHGTTEVENDVVRYFATAFVKGTKDKPVEFLLGCC